MKSLVVKRSVSINGHKTSVSLEEGFWEGVKEIARLNGKTTQDLIGDIERSRTTSNLSSALRLSVLEHFRQNGPMLSGENAPDSQAPSVASG
jgi:predicted DNA-binding ribbon-helix-helix protein